MRILELIGAAAVAGVLGLGVYITLLNVRWGKQPAGQFKKERRKKNE